MKARKLAVILVPVAFIAVLVVGWVVVKAVSGNGLDESRDQWRAAVSERERLMEWSTSLEPDLSGVRVPSCDSGVSVVDDMKAAHVKVIEVFDEGMDLVSKPAWIARSSEATQEISILGKTPEVMDKWMVELATKDELDAATTELIAMNEKYAAALNDYEAAVAPVQKALERPSNASWCK